MPWEPPKDLPLLGPFSCTWTREDEGLPPRVDGGCVHCGGQPEDEIHSEKRRAEVAALFADRKTVGGAVLPLSPFRFTWRTAATVKDTSDGWLPQMDQGYGFRAVRVMYGLTLREVADGWRVSHVELGELERGHRHFVTPADMQAALSQLWLWAVEKNPGIAR